MTVKVYGRTMIVRLVVDGWTIMDHSMYRSTTVCARCHTLILEGVHSC